MLKKQIAILLCLVLLVSQVVFLVFTSESSQLRLGQEKLEYVQQQISPNVNLYDSLNSPKVPTFSLDWTLWSKYNARWGTANLFPAGAYLHPSFFTKSLPLFDVKWTFIHNFYFW